jgi:hypothetical protein
MTYGSGSSKPTNYGQAGSGSHLDIFVTNASSTELTEPVRNTAWHKAAKRKPRLNFSHSLTGRFSLGGKRKGVLAQSLTH